MTIKYFLKNKIKSKLFILSVATIILVIPFMCASVYTQENKNISENDPKIKIPVVMYHMISKDGKTKNKFTICARTFEEDLQYINNNGYTTIFVKDMIDYTENKSELPKKPILLTFDDGALNNYTYAFPLAKKYNAKFVFSPIAIEVEKYSKIKDENPSYAHASWDKIKEMSESGLVEIQNHTYNLHHVGCSRTGCKQKPGESKEHYKDILVEDLQKSQDLMQHHQIPIPTAFFYPYGAYGKYSEEIIKSMGFKASFICEGKIGEISKNPDSLFKIGRFIRPPGISSQKFFSKFEK